MSRMLSAKKIGITPLEKSLLIEVRDLLRKQAKNKSKSVKIDGVKMSFNMSNYFVVKAYHGVEVHTCETAGCIAGYMFTAAYAKKKERQLLKQVADVDELLIDGAEIKGSKNEKAESLSRLSAIYGAYQHNEELVELFHPPKMDLIDETLAANAIDHYLKVGGYDFTWFEVPGYQDALIAEGYEELIEDWAASQA